MFQMEPTSIIYFVLFFEVGSHVVQVDLELAMQPRMNSNY